MARQERNTVDYFPHLIGNGKKIKFIEQKYGNDGYTTWFKILESLASTDYHYLNLNDEINVMHLASNCRISEDKLFSIINDLVRLNVLSNDLWDVKIIWSQVFIDSIKDVYKKRTNECITLPRLRLLLSDLGILKPCKSILKPCKSILQGSVNPQTKLNYTKDIINTNNINIDFVKLLGFFNTVTGKKSKVVPKKAKEQINARLKEGFTKEDIASAIKNCFADKYHIETNHKHLTLEFITRADKLEKYSSIKEKKTQTKLTETDHLKRDKF